MSFTQFFYMLTGYVPIFKMKPISLFDGILYIKIYLPMLIIHFIRFNHFSVRYKTLNVLCQKSKITILCHSAHDRFRFHLLISTFAHNVSRGLIRAITMYDMYITHRKHFTEICQVKYFAFYISFTPMYF